jgi:hypothetical protein
MTDSHPFILAREARLTPNDFAKMLKVSRVTASCWFNNRCNPHHLLRHRVDRVMAAIQAAMDAGDFPVPYEIPRRERFLYVSRVITKHLPADNKNDEALSA